MMFGVSSAPEIYQYTIQQVLKDCPGSKNRRMTSLDLSMLSLFELLVNIIHQLLIL